MLSLATEETGEFVPLAAEYVNQDGGDVEGNEDDYEEEDVISQGEKGSATTLPITEMRTCCDKNSAAIHELSSKFDALEAKMEQLRPQLSPSCQGKNL